MSKSTLLRVGSLFLGLMLCLVSAPAAFAQSENGGVGNDTVCPPVPTEIVTHEINPNYYNMNLQQGESGSFNVSFRNNGNEALNIEPKIAAVPNSYSNLDESWITISPASATVDPSAEQEFTVEINVPEDADGGNFETYIAFTDDLVPGSGTDYPQYVNAMYLSFMVPVYQKLELQTSYISDTIEAGKEYEYTMKIKNVADKNITINPKATRYDYTVDTFGLEDDAIEISAPSVLTTGEIADMTIKVPVPENATGTYSGYIAMNVNGKENNGYEPQIELNFIVKQPLSVPYVKTFSTRTADPITIEVSTYTYGSDLWLRSPPKETDPSFKLNLKYNSSPVDMTLVKTTQSDNIYIGWDNFPVWSNNENPNYQNNDRHYTETYTIPGAIGDWELSILPTNADNFAYSINVGDSE